VISISRNALQGIGDHITPIISSFIELVGKYLTVIFLAPKLGYMGIILSEPIVWVLMVIPLLIKCKKNVVFRPGVY
jgi:Na+-driven multidrug efflux pump